MPSDVRTSTDTGGPVRFSLSLTRKDLDFAWGFGRYIKHVEVNMEYSPDPAGNP